jgi:DNA-binding response OmpR family regulator
VTVVPKQKPKIIVIDDDLQVLHTMTLALRRQYVVLTASEPEAGVKLVLDQDPDVVLCDVKMPRHDGFWVLSEIRKHNTDVPVVFNSAYQETVAQGDVSAIYKPFAYLHKTGEYETFLATLEAAVKARQAQRSAIGA